MVAYLCEAHAYVDVGDGALLDISPTSPIVAPGSVVAGGYGDNTYSLGTYGTARPNRADTSKLVSPGYYLDNWGQNLLLMTSTDGRLLMWDPTTPATKAAAVSGAPTGNRGFVVHPLRYVLLFAAGGVMARFSWCNQEDITNWNYADVASKAGFYDVEPASPIVAASRSMNDVVFFTENGKGYYIEHIGLPYIFSTESFGAGCTPVSPMAIGDGPEGAVWLSSGGIFGYKSRSAVPIDCPLWNWKQANYNEASSRVGAATFIVPSTSEIWFSFSTGAVLGINDRTMVFNYVEKWWTQAYIGRTAGLNAVYTGYPIMATASAVFDHEVGMGYEGADLPWASTFPFTMNFGASLATMISFFPDYDGSLPAISFKLDYNIPRASETIDGSTGNRPVEGDGYVYFPTQPTGRDFRLTVSQVQENAPAWTVGDNIAYLIPRGSQ